MLTCKVVSLDPMASLNVVASVSGKLRVTFLNFLQIFRHSWLRHVTHSCMLKSRDDLLVRLAVL